MKIRINRTKEILTVYKEKVSQNTISEKIVFKTKFTKFALYSLRNKVLTGPKVRSMHIYDKILLKEEFDRVIKTYGK